MPETKRLLARECAISQPVKSKAKTRAKTQHSHILDRRHKSPCKYKLPALSNLGYLDSEPVDLRFWISESRSCIRLDCKLNCKKIKGTKLALFSSDQPRVKISCVGKCHMISKSYLYRFLDNSLLGSL